MQKPTSNWKHVRAVPRHRPRCRLSSNRSHTGIHNSSVVDYSSWLRNVLELPKGFLTRQALRIAAENHECANFHDDCEMLTDALSEFGGFPLSEARRIVSLFVFMTSWKDVASFSSEQAQQYLEKWKVTSASVNDMMSEVAPEDLCDMVLKLVDNYYRIDGEVEHARYFYMRWLVTVVETGLLSRQTLGICVENHECANFHTECGMLGDLQKGDVKDGDDEDDEDEVKLPININRIKKVVRIFSDFGAGQDGLMARLHAEGVTPAEVNDLLTEVSPEQLANLVRKCTV